MSLGEGVVAFARIYYQDNDESLVSVDRKTTIMPMVMTGSLGDAGENIGTVLEIVEKFGFVRRFFRVLYWGCLKHRSRAE